MPTQTTNRKFERYTNTQPVVGLTNTQIYTAHRQSQKQSFKMQACLPRVQRAQQHGCQVTEVLITRSFGKPEMIITFNYIQLY